MKILSIFILAIIEVTLCCDDSSQINLLPPFQDVRNIQLKIGDDINIICCHPDGGDFLSWQDKSKNKIVFKNLNGVFSLKDDKNRLILRIDNIDQNKMGEYTCINNKQGLSKSILLTARAVPLTPDIIKKELFFPSNKPIAIKCPLHANQGLKSWIFTRGGKNVAVNKPGGDGSYDLSKDKMMFKIIRDDIKVVWCQFQEIAANGDMKTNLYEFTWTIYEPIDVQLVIDHKGPILESTDVRLLCSFRYDPSLSVVFPNNMIPKTNFLLNNKNITNGKLVLTINKITKDLEGDYECKVTKFVSMEPFQAVEESASVKVDVMIAPKIISNDFITSSTKLNDDAYLTCQIKSSQLTMEDVHFEYYRRDISQWVKLSDFDGKYDIKLIKNGINNASLIVKKVIWNDRGKYKCVAKNAAGEDSKIGLLKIEKPPELNSSVTVIYIATKPVIIECSVSGYPISLSDDIIELRVLDKSSTLAVKVIATENSDIDGLSVTYEVASRGELIVGSAYKLQCFYQNKGTSQVQQKEIDLRIAQKPGIPLVDIVCSGSSGIVFKYQILLSDDENQKMVKNVLYYASSEDFDGMIKKPSKVIPIREDETKESMIYVLKDLVASRNYTFKWESFNSFGMSNERILTYNTKDLMPPQTPKILHFSTKGNMINVNVTWLDDCPYTGSNSDIMDIVVTMKSIKNQDGKRNIWQWTDKNFTIESDRGSAQFLIFLENPQMDYEIQVALRSLQGTSESVSGVYRANVVLSGSLFSCFPRCSGSRLSLYMSHVQSPLVVLLVLVLLRLF